MSVREEFLWRHCIFNISKDDFSAEVGKVTLKINSDEALNDEFILKCNGNEALNDGFL